MQPQMATRVTPRMSCNGNGSVATLHTPSGEEAHVSPFSVYAGVETHTTPWQEHLAADPMNPAAG